jgi:hypothetical protein
MRVRSTAKPRVSPYHVLAQKHAKDRVYRFLRFSHFKVDAVMKKRILEKILAEGKTIGAIEWFEKGGIIHKPKVPLEIIIISEP